MTNISALREAAEHADWMQVVLLARANQAEADLKVARQASRDTQQESNRLAVLVEDAEAELEDARAVLDTAHLVPRGGLLFTVELDRAAWQAWQMRAKKEQA